MAVQRDNTRETSYSYRLLSTAVQGGNTRETSYLYQRPSMAVQRANTLSLPDTFVFDERNETAIAINHFFLTIVNSKPANIVPAGVLEIIIKRL